MRTKGFSSVMWFTVVQKLKTKTFIVSTVLTLVAVMLISAATNLIPAFIAVSGKDNPTDIKEVKIDKLYFYNESGTCENFASYLNSALPKTQVIEINDCNGVVEELKTTTNLEMLLKLYKKEDGSFMLLAVKPVNAAVDEQDLILSYSYSLFLSVRLTDAGVSSDQIEPLLADVSIDTITAGEETKTFGQMLSEMYIPMALGLLLFLLIYMYGYWVATSMISEKSSRVMELLLTSVKPMAVVLGKLLGMGLLAISHFILILVSAGVSYKVSGGLADIIAPGGYSAVDLSALTSGISVGSIIAVIFVFILGYILYAEINAVSGATVSSSEDMQMALLPVNMLAVIGFYLAYCVSAFGSPAYEKLVMLLPISSPFYLPSAIFMGNASIGMILLSIAILLVSIVIVFLFTTKVYSEIVLHNGSRLKLKDLFTIYKNK